MTGRIEMFTVESGNHKSSLEHKRFKVGSKLRCLWDIGVGKACGQLSGAVDWCQQEDWS